VLVLDLLGIIEVFSVLGRANFPGPEGQTKTAVCPAPSPSLDFIPLPFIPLPDFPMNSASHSPDSVSSGSLRLFWLFNF
jgi:hypothetical protein